MVKVFEITDCEGQQASSAGTDPAIILAADDNYAMGMGIVLQSILDHGNSSNTYKFYLISDGISEQNRKRIELIAKTSRNPSKLEWLEAGESILSNMPSNSSTEYFTRAAYLRLAIPDLLDGREERVIYLDCDILVCQDLLKLWQQDLEGKALAAVQDWFVTSLDHSHGIKCYAELGLQGGERYFNSGVMLMDINQLKEINLYKKASQYLTKYATIAKFADQEALNAVLAGYWKCLDHGWNVTSEIVDVPWIGSCIYPQSLEIESEYLVQNAKIIHFTGPVKPWHPGSQHPRTGYWWHTYKRSRWHEHL